MAELKVPEDEVIAIPKDDVASQNRFIYYPDRLVQMPTPYGNPFVSALKAGYAALTEPIYSGVIGSLLAETRVRQRPLKVRDESVGEFMKRRFGPAIADNLVSAFFHGIYAGDIYKLSARTLLPALWYTETRDPEGNGVLTEFGDLFMKGRTLMSLKRLQNLFLIGDSEEVVADGMDADRITRSLSGASIYTFVNGLATLPKAIHAALASNSNVTIRTSAEVFCPLYDRASDKLVIVDSEQKATRFDYAVSTLRPGHFGKLPPKSSKPHEQLARPPPTTFPLPQINKAATVMVVNLYYPNPNLIPDQYRGFGYLIPRSVALDRNPERALGVIFGSEASGLRGSEAVREFAPFTEQDYLRARKNVEQVKAMTAQQHKEFEDMRQMSPRVQKGLEIQASRAVKQQEEEAESIKANIGKVRIIKRGQDTAPGTKLTVMLGGHWWSEWTESDYPSETEAIQMARNVLERHLYITEEPEVAKARLQKDAIPQYEIGWRDHMAKFHKEVLTDMFHGRLKVCGPWWQGGVGVNDCIQKSKEVTLAIRQGEQEKTGLEEFVGEEKWILQNRKTGHYEKDPMCDAY